MIANFKYLWYVLKHKYFVFVAGRKLGCGVWQLVVHDLSKFSKAEWKPYVDRFIRKRDNKKDYFKAWVHHYENNPHHWNFWIDPYTDRPHPIPDYFLLEMIADWLGAGRAKTGHWDIVEWYCKNKNKMKLHPATRTVVESLIPGYDSFWDKHYNNNVNGYSTVA